MTSARHVTDPVLVEMTNEELCLNVEEQMVVDSEVLVHGGDLLQPSSSDSDLLVPLSGSFQPSGDQQSVAVVEVGQATGAGKALLWTYGRSAFYVSPAAVLSGVPTAVVAPIKREPPDSIQSSGVQHPSTPQSHPGGAGEPSVVPSPVQAHPPSLSKAHLPPFETFRAPAISGGSSSMTSSASVSASSGDTPSSAMNLSLATRSTTKSDAAGDLKTEPLPMTSFCRQPVTSSFAPFPLAVWSLQTAVPSAEDGAQPRPCSATDQLFVSTPFKTNDGHVTAQLLPVQQIPPFSTAEVIPSAPRRAFSNGGNAYKLQ